MKSTVFLITILISLFLTACSCPVCDIVDNRYPKTLKMIGVPEKIKEKVDNYIAAKTGEDFFVKYVSLNETASFFDSVKYYWVYDISIPGKEWVTGKIDLFTDSLGNIDQLMEVNGIPDCGTNPNGCSFDITPNQAFKIAIKEGLKPGIKEWSQKFLWNAKFNRYVWQIISTLEESQGSQGFRGSGEEIIIDASTGEKLDFNEWKVR
ncbi:MAG: hypothetical protein IPI12_14460 [Ignavibacteriales bacterium]|jgi:hypothetical protein|nr:hypothetical protein [Ignavibacteriales bacterium]